MRPTKRSTTLITGVAAALGAISFASPAHAHDTGYYIGDPNWPRGTVWVKDNHRLLEICDKRADDYGVYVEYWYWDAHVGAYRYDTLRDVNGSQKGCGETDFDAYRVLDSFNGHCRNGAATGWQEP